MKKIVRKDLVCKRKKNHLSSGQCTCLQKCFGNGKIKGSVLWIVGTSTLFPRFGSLWFNEIADELARVGSAQQFVGPEPLLGVSRQNIRRKMKWWIENKHLALWRGPCSTQRQARELIVGPDLAMGVRLLSFNRTQTRVVTGLLTGHNTLKRHLHIMGLCNDPMYRKCGTEEETSIHILCECEALALHRHAYLGCSFLDLEDIWELGVGAIWNIAKGTGLL